MQRSYLDQVTELLIDVRPKLADTHDLEFKNVFGAVAGYVNDRIFISVGKFGVALRLSPRILADLFKKRDVKELKYFPKGHVKKEYAVLPPRILENRERLKTLVNESIKYVETLPA